MKSTLFSVAALVALSSAAPAKRDLHLNDGQILNYALTLEHLEATFYREGLQKFSVDDFKSAGFDEDTYSKLEIIASDEVTHVAAITAALKALGVPAVAECKYDFGYNDVEGFLTTASILEGVGVTAYTGAAADIMSKEYLTNAASILAVEARHSSYIRNKLKQVPFAEPFDDPLTYNEVYSLAAPFFTSCPASNPTLPLKAFPMLTASSTDSPIKTGSKVTLQTKGYKIEGKVYAAFITLNGAIFVDATPVDGGFQIVVPENKAGQSYVVLTSCSTAVTDDTIVAGPAIVEIS